MKLRGALARCIVSPPRPSRASGDRNRQNSGKSRLVASGVFLNNSRFWNNFHRLLYYYRISDPDIHFRKLNLLCRVTFVTEAGNLTAATEFRWHAVRPPEPLLLTGLPLLGGYLYPQPLGAWRSSESFLSARLFNLNHRYLCHNRIFRGVVYRCISSQHASTLRARYGIVLKRVRQENKDPSVVENKRRGLSEVEKSASSLWTRQSSGQAAE